MNFIIKSALFKLTGKFDSSLFEIKYLYFL